MQGLPQSPTRFIGRKSEIERILLQLKDADCRLLTLVGVGGIGKTRLAIEAGQMLATDSGLQAQFVNLQPILDADQLPIAVAAAVGFELTGSSPLSEQMYGHLQASNLLLILDNFEQLLESTQQTTALKFIAGLLAHTDSIKLLVTSREPLGIVEEWRYPVGGLNCGSEDSEAAKLFARCAKRVRPHFDASAEIDDIATLCRLVGGMPLALELAASWAKSLSVAEIVEELTDSAELLTTNLRNLPERHRSIEAVIDQTWRQLDTREQAAFTKLAIFRGGFQRQAAKAVAGASLPLLASLLDKSLLRWETSKR